VARVGVKPASPAGARLDLMTKEDPARMLAL